MVMQEKEVTIEVLCNQCGESCCPPSSCNVGTPVKWVPDVGHVVISEEEALALHGRDFYGLIEQTVSGGYFSSNDENGLCDMESYTFSLCEKCLKTIFKGFKIPVQTKEYNFG